MKSIPKQTDIPARKAAQIAARSLKIRLSRSLLTLLTIAMGIAFLTNIWTTAAYDSAAHLADPALPPSSGRNGLLVTLSLLVCMVGITNAMLMSVVERFREIGTMKCLGALDSFILRLFLFESLMLGAAGSALGVLLGLPATALTLLLQHDANLPWPQLPTIAISSFLIGIAITALAGYFPAHRAAKMDPIAAMRVEV